VGAALCCLDSAGTTTGESREFAAGGTVLPRGAGGGGTAESGGTFGGVGGGEGVLVLGATLLGATPLFTPLSLFSCVTAIFSGGASFSSIFAVFLSLTCLSLTLVMSLRRTLGEFEGTTRTLATVPLPEIPA
jgi:hypothetical protein